MRQMGGYVIGVYFIKRECGVGDVVDNCDAIGVGQEGKDVGIVLFLLGKLRLQGEALCCNWGREGET